MEEKFVIEFVDHVEGLFVIGEFLEMFEDEHNPVFEGVYCVDVFLVFCLDFEEGVHEAHSLQVLGKRGITIVSTKTLQDVLDFLGLLALPLWQLSETKASLVHSHFTLPQILHGILSGHYRLRKKLLIQVFRRNPRLSPVRHILNLPMKRRIFGYLSQLDQCKPSGKSFVDIIPMLVSQYELVDIAPTLVDLLFLLENDLLFDHQPTIITYVVLIDLRSAVFNGINMKMDGAWMMDGWYLSVVVGFLYNKMRNLLVLGLLLVVTLGLDVRHCDASPQPLLPFTYIDGTPDSTTTASLCYDETYLYVNWQSIDTEIISTFNNCNDPLWQEDVVEIFIASPDSYPTNYFEFEVSPKSKLFFADITNANGDCSSLGDQFYECGLAEYGSEIVANGWNAWFKVRLDTIGRGKAYNKYLINILRCDYSTNQPIRYLTWQPTFANPACFHKPAYFQEINLI